MTEQRSLSPREFEVLQLIAEGLQHKEIATRLGLSTSTVGVYSSNVRIKLDQHSIVHLVVYAIRHGLVKLPGIAAVEVSS